MPSAPPLPATAGAPPLDAHYPARGYAWYVMGVLLLVMAFAYLDRLAISFLITPIQADLGLNDIEAGLLLGPAFTIAFLLAAYPAGHFADRYSRKWILIAGLVIWSAATGLSGFATNFAGLAAARAGIGLGEACLIPTIFSLVADYFPPDKRGRATAVVTIGTALGAGAALYGGGFALKLADATLGMPALAALPASGWGRVLIGFGALGVLMTLLMLTVREPPRQGSDSAGNDQGLSARAFFRLLLKYWPAFLLVLAPYILLNYAQYALAGWIPTLLARREGLTPADAAITYGLVVMLSSPAAAILGGILADRATRRRADGRFSLVKYFMPIFMLGTILICFTSDIRFIQAGIALEIFATGIILTTVYVAMSEIVPASARGRMLGTYSLLATVFGVGFGPTVTAFISEWGFGDASRLDSALMLAITPAWLVAMGCALIGGRHFSKLVLRANEGGLR